jgi:hypothetical protein
MTKLFRLPRNNKEENIEEKKWKLYLKLNIEFMLDDRKWEFFFLIWTRRLGSAKYFGKISD